MGWLDKEPENEQDKELWVMQGGPQNMRLNEAAEKMAELAAQRNLNGFEFDDVVRRTKGYHTSFSVNPNKSE